VPAYANARFEPDYAKLRNRPGWRCCQAPCGHDVMVDMPDRLAENLEQVA